MAALAFALGIIALVLAVWIFAFWLIEETSDLFNASLNFGVVSVILLAAGGQTLAG